MAFGASFDVGRLIAYWAMEYRREGVHLSRAAVTWLNLGALVFAISAIIDFRLRRPDRPRRGPSGVRRSPHPESRALRENS